MGTRASAPARKRTGGTEDGDVDPALPQKKRARHRLIGAIALCLLAAIVVPLLLDPEPTRPVSDIAIVVPSRDTPLPPRGDAKSPDGKAESKADPKSDAARPGTVARGAIEPAPASAGVAEPKGAESKGSDTKGSDAKASDAKAAETKAAETKAAETKAADPKSTAPPKDSAKDPAKDPAKDSAKAAARKDPKGDEIQQLAEVAQAKARGEATGRYLLQVGAFGGEAGANAAIDKVEAAGLRAFTEKIKTERGDRVRVRVGPFPSRETAEQARTRLKAAGIEAAVIAP
jgi:DedD protein